MEICGIPSWLTLADDTHEILIRISTMVNGSWSCTYFSHLICLFSSVVWSSEAHYASIILRGLITSQLHPLCPWWRPPLQELTYRELCHLVKMTWLICGKVHMCKFWVHIILLSDSPPPSPLKIIITLLAHPLIPPLQPLKKMLNSSPTQLPFKCHFPPFPTHTHSPFLHYTFLHLFYCSHSLSAPFIQNPTSPSTPS